MLYIFSKALSFHDITTQILAQNISIFVTLFLARERVRKVRVYYPTPFF